MMPATEARNDVGAENDRGKERSRRAVWTTLSSLGAHATGLLTSLVSVPLTLEYLGKERYGLWGSVTALLTWATLADFGLGRGLINHLSEAYARNDTDAAGRYVSTGWYALLGVALLMAGAFGLLMPIVPWTALFNVQSRSLEAETSSVVVAVVAVFLVNFPMSIVGSIYSAYQRGYVANAFRVVGNVTSLAVLVAATRTHVGLAGLVAVMGGVPLLLGALNLVYIARDMPWLWPKRRSVSWATFRELATVSTPLFLFQVGSLLINELQTLVIARRAGLTTVADYTVFLKVYSVPVLILGMIDGPLVPSFREALLRRDVLWLRTTFWRAQGIKLVICVAATVYYVGFGNVATSLLSGQTVAFESRVWMAASLLTLVGTWNGSFNDLLISTNRLWTLVRFILANGVVTATLTYFAAERLGVFGIVSATVAYSLVVTAWIFPVICWRHVSPMATAEALAVAAEEVSPGA
ncbi:MAG TPA: lipopolysaccharide biosynthesis protein [Polyangiaceae bacterium]|nr:lipopolysaccharide biosynthesis protein [Polyangiaceae bacterium]